MGSQNCPVHPLSFLEFLPIPNDIWLPKMDVLWSSLKMALLGSPKVQSSTEPFLVSDSVHTWLPKVLLTQIQTVLCWMPWALVNISFDSIPDGFADEEAEVQ